MANFPDLVNSSRPNRAVVQLGRTLEWGSRGRGFKSRQPEYIYAFDSESVSFKMETRRGNKGNGDCPNTAQKRLSADFLLATYDQSWKEYFG